MIEAIFFDRDGVIIDSESINIQSAISAFEKIGIKIKNVERNNIAGTHPIDYVEYFQKQYSFSKSEFLEYQRNFYYKLFSSVSLVDGIGSLLDKLKLDKYKLALVTSSHLDSTNTVLKNAGLEKIFDVIVTFEDCKKRKSNPEPYLKAIKKMNVSPNECLVIEDSISGIQAAKSAGCYCVAITTTDGRDKLTDADIVVDRLSEIDENLISSITG